MVGMMHLLPLRRNRHQAFDPFRFRKLIAKCNQFIACRAYVGNPPHLPWLGRAGIMVQSTIPADIKARRDQGKAASMPEAHHILDRLRRLAMRDNRPEVPMTELSGTSSLFAFVTRKRERIAGAAFSRTSIVAIVEGAKDVITMGRHFRFPAGTVLVLPGGWRGDVVNDPDPQSGVYRAVLMDFPDVLARRAASAFAPARMPSRFDLPLDPILAGAIHHAGEGIASGGLPQALIEHRVLEVLMILAMRGALPALSGTTEEAVRLLVRWQSDRQWTADTIASELGTSNATLRRRLAGEATSLRKVLVSERIALAEAMLAEDGASLHEAALATGYRSSRRFADRLRTARERSRNIALA
jgi:AraC-like DNA-binding protein